MKSLRRELQSALSVPASLLKQANEQTIVALAAVHQAIQSSQKSAQDFAEWGIIASTRFLGRQKLAETLPTYESEGALAISPHLVAHHLPHSVSACISVALGLRGLNWGFGGGTNLEEIFLALPGVLANDLPGIWVVVSSWEPEQLPTPTDKVPETLLCRAAALGLVLDPRGAACVRVQVPGNSQVTKTQAPCLTAKTMFDALTDSASPENLTQTQWTLAQGGSLSIQPTKHTS